jgi:hypothetical protein
VRRRRVRRRMRNIWEEGEDNEKDIVILLTVNTCLLGT